MNKSGIEWCDHTWNPITGCRHGCSYCYADKMSLRFCGNMKEIWSRQTNIEWREICLSWMNRS